MLSRPTGHFSSLPIFSPFVDPDLLAGYPSAYRPGARHRRCRSKIITSLLLPSPTRRKPGSHIAVGNPLNSLPLFLSFSALFVRPARSCSLRRAFIHVRLLPRSSLLLRLPPVPLCGFLSTGWHTTCRARAEPSFVPIRWKSLACRKSLRADFTTPNVATDTDALVVTFNISISIYYVGYIFFLHFSLE